MNDNATYLDRFPVAHRASADRAYQDGFQDGADDVQERLDDLSRTARQALGFFGKGPLSVADKAILDDLSEALSAADR